METLGLRERGGEGEGHRSAQLWRGVPRQAEPRERGLETPRSAIGTERDRVGGGG